MIAHCNADTAEAAVLRACRLDQVASRARLAVVEQRMVERIVLKSSAMSVWRNMVASVPDAKPGQDVRRYNDNWDRQKQSCW